jgi:hypothetical protein
LYVAAILEIDKDKIPSRIHAAKMVICDRIEELHCGGSATERMALNRAMKALGELQQVNGNNAPSPYPPPVNHERLANQERQKREAA